MNKCPCERKHPMPQWANYFYLYKKCPKKTKIEKNNVLENNGSNLSKKMRYAQLVKRNGSHWTNNKLYIEKRNKFLNNYYVLGKRNFSC